MPSIPDAPTIVGLEDKWAPRWEDDGVYRFRGAEPRENVYSIDTPPPTVSGVLHVGSVFSFTHPDIVARFQRMLGKDVFYPMGWDDNGLPTERRVQNYFGVRCDPSLPYEPNFVPQKTGVPVRVSRPNFVELCLALTHEDERAFEALWRRLGLSVDWTLTYATIGRVAQRVSQLSFLRLLESGDAYQAEAPTLWDVDFRTAVAQAELEDREIAGTICRVRFHHASGPVYIETTRPELLPACVALVAHPDDARYTPLFGTTVTTPVFGASVPVRPHPLANPEKGTGIAMVCTFGDVTDVLWWRELGLPVRALMNADGTFRPVSWGAPGWECADPAAAQAAYDTVVGVPSEKARPRIVERLREAGDLIGEPRGVTHAVKFYEKGDRPLEILTSRQWYLRSMEYREDLLERGRQIGWHPDFMRMRYETWVSGLNGDWGLSRQRFFGVPFPVWYPLDERGAVQYDTPIVPTEKRLPVDPSTDAPDGYDAAQRGQPNGFAGDPDVMDTWATSALTPQIAGGWESNPDRFARVFPMDLRPQAHDIIRTWLFYSVLRAHIEHGSVPWRNTLISGFVVDPDRKKMSKSKGNAATPEALLREYGSDAVRYWSAKGRPGTDTAFDTGKIKVGRRLAIKILNASRFVLAGSVSFGSVDELIDQAMLRRLASVVDEATAALTAYEYTDALEHTETFFWWLCDDYLELVKDRYYGLHGPDRAASAKHALAHALDVILRLFAPVLPFVTEEVWSWWREGSIHLARWPTPAELTRLVTDPDANEPVLRVASDTLTEIRRQKSAASRGIRSRVARARVRDLPERLAILVRLQSDIMASCQIERLEMEEGNELVIELELEDAPGETVL